MKLHILGSGTCIPSSRRGSSGYAVILDNTKLLLDCGNGTTWKLEKSGIDYLDIDYIFLTHLHPDHTADLIPFLFGTKYNIERIRKKPLNIIGPEGFCDFFSSLNNTFYNYLDFEGLNVSELRGDTITNKNFGMKWLGTPHTDTSVAYRLVSGEKTLVYTGDTDYSEELAEFANESNLLLTECSYPDGRKITGHLTPNEVSRIANISNSDKIVVTHMYPSCDNVDLLNQIKANTDKEVIIAEDFMEIEV